MAPSLAELGVGWRASEGGPGGWTEADWDPSSSALWMGGGSPPGAASSPMSTWTFCPWTTRHLVWQSSTWNADVPSAKVAACSFPWSGRRTAAAGLPWTWWRVWLERKASKGNVQLSWGRSVLQVSATRCRLGDRSSLEHLWVQEGGGTQCSEGATSLLGDPELSGREHRKP